MAENWRPVCSPARVSETSIFEQIEFGRQHIGQWCWFDDLFFLSFRLTIYRDISNNVVQFPSSVHQGCIGWTLTCCLIHSHSHNRQTKLSFEHPIPALFYIPCCLINSHTHNQQTKWSSEHPHSRIAAELLYHHIICFSKNK